MKGRWGVPAIALLFGLLGVPRAALAQVAGFPHRAHEGLFPLCAGCHSLNPQARVGITVPEPQSCTRCHDGETRPRVGWQGRGDPASNLDFSHTEHPRAVGGEAVECASCHGVPGRPSRMAVQEARPSACIGCHEHQAPAHLAPDAACRRCHVPLTEARTLPAARIARFPSPSSHVEDDFATSHGGMAEASTASCSVCHAQESCSRCHLNAGSLPAIRSLARDARVATLAAELKPAYPEPPSHSTDSWTWLHRDAVRADGTGACANCHTRSSCRACHLSGEASALATLPEPPSDDPRGVKAEAVEGSVHAPGFATGHKIEASAMGSSCESCHQRSSFCVTCHEGSGDPGFHLDDFLSQHAAEAYGSEVECASCHNPELFCRSCHQGVGLTSQGRLDAGFHNAQPFWLLEHGEGARKGLESCITCHAQNDCAQCHSARGGWRVNPHGPDFDARRMRDQAPLTCLRCHFGDPLGGGG